MVPLRSGSEGGGTVDMVRLIGRAALIAAAATIGLAVAIAAALSCGIS